MSKPFIPLNPQEFSQRYGKDTVPDFVLVSGDAYVDHPSFGPALIGRLLESEGYRVAIIAQPDWRKVDDFAAFGRPRLAFLVTAGNLDSMVANYSAFKRPRRQDDYSPGAVAGKRPDRALIVYTGRIRQAFKGVTVVLGGIEASLRRLSHYDYWSDSIRRSVLMDAKADYLLYGMAEKSVVELARALEEKQTRGIDVPAYKIRGLLWALPGKEAQLDQKSNHIILSSYDNMIIPAQVLPPFEEILEDRRRYADHFALQLHHADPFSAQSLVEPCGDRLVIQNPPAMPLSTEELDRIYELPYLRRYHPSYDNIGGVPALEEVRFSLVSSRGCFGGCSFCALTFHQGRIISARSHESLIREARLLIADPGFKGYIHDAGGPTANFRQPSCSRQKNHGACPDRQCLFPSPCPNLQPDHSDYLALLKKLRSLPGVKKVFIRSGIRYDYLLEDGNTEFMRELVAHHISGQLKVAPEHAGKKTLHAMGKPPISVYRRFSDLFKKENEAIGKKQYLIPYLIAGHPGSDLSEAIELALFLKESGFIPDQVQDFYPTPGTVSTCMWATGIDPRDGKPVYIPKGDKERNLQRALLQFHKPENHQKVREALKKAGRSDLIGWSPGALVPPGRQSQSQRQGQSQGR